MTERGERRTGAGKDSIIGKIGRQGRSDGLREASEAPEILTNDGCMVEYEEGLWDFAKKVTHEQPDSWILWGDDLDMAVKVGEVDKVEMMRRAKALEEENAELKAELADWKCNAEGFKPDAYMKLPLDADGEPIRIGDVLYSSGNECRVVSITVKADEACVGVHTDEGAFLPSVNPKYLSRKKPEPADSWEKLEEDARKTACNYAPAPLNEDGLVTCDGCRFQNSESCSNEMTLDVVERAKKLAGIEEEVRNGD